MQLATQHFVAVAGGVTREIFLATCLATFVERQVARKIASCNMALGSIGSMPPRLDEVESKMASSISDETLAESVRKYPMLYDKSCAEFRDKLKKTLPWTNVAKELGLKNGMFYDRK